VSIWWRRLIPIALSALVLPGLGQLYMRRYVRGSLLAAVFLAILLFMTVQIVRDVMAVPPSHAAFSSYFAQMLQGCLSSFAELLPSWGPLLAVVWGYSLADTMRLAWRWGPDGRAGAPP